MGVTDIRTAEAQLAAAEAAHSGSKHRSRSRSSAGRGDSHAGDNTGDSSGHKDKDGDAGDASASASAAGDKHRQRDTSADSRGSHEDEEGEGHGAGGDAASHHSGEPTPKRRRTSSVTSINGMSSPVARTMQAAAAASPAAPPGPTKRLRVHLPHITDWCIDYQPDLPTLWVISDGAWYCIGGIRTVHPSTRYAKHFWPAFFKFQACITVARVLMDLLPVNPDVAYRVVVREVEARSKRGCFPISEAYLVAKADFIAEQVAQLDNEQTKGLYRKSKFISMLKARAEEVKKVAAKRVSLGAAKEFRDKHKAFLDQLRKCVCCAVPWPWH